MLPPFIIDQIKRREEEERQRDRDRPVLELPLPPLAPSPMGYADEEKGERGVIIIDVVG